jgi:hypothetical protein
MHAEAAQIMGSILYFTVFAAVEEHTFGYVNIKRQVTEALHAFEIQTLVLVLPAHLSEP